jgi:hypothetical protein
MSRIENLETAFQIIQNVLKQKDERIRELDEENRSLKIRLSEFEEKVSDKIDDNEHNFKDSDLLKQNYYSERENIVKNNQSKEMKGLIYSPNPYNLNYNYVSETKNSNNNLNTKDSNSISGSASKPTRTILSPINPHNNNSNIASEPEKNHNYSTNNFRKDNNIANDSSSRNEVKYFLNEVKEKIPARDFKEFIKYIKILTDKSQVCLNRKEILDNVKSLFGNKQKDLYLRFEQLLSVKK